MSQQRHTRSNHSALSAWAVAMIAVAAIAVAPTCTNANEEKQNGKPMPTEQMDHSKMDCTKDMSMSKTGDVDYDFAANMHHHHQMAVEMSEAEIKNGRDPKLQRMAKDIIAAQKKEIAELDEWMAAHKKAMPEAMPK